MDSMEQQVINVRPENPQPIPSAHMKVSVITLDAENVVCDTYVEGADFVTTKQPTTKVNFTTATKIARGTLPTTNRTVLDHFLRLYNDDLITMTLECMNYRRDARYEERKTKEGLRGRPVTQSQELYEKDRNKYLKRFNDCFDHNDLFQFLACFFRISTINFHTLDQYWSDCDETKCGTKKWFDRRMKQYKFMEMWNCLDLDGEADKWLDGVLKSIQCDYTPHKWLCVDESIAPIQCNNNPHHVFVQRKPHPHGIKFEDVADANMYLISFNMHKRTSTDYLYPPIDRSKKLKLVREDVLTTTIPDVLGTLLSHLQGSHIVVGDSWFGGCDPTIAVTAMGHHALFKCKSDRPGFLFRDLLNTKKVNQHKTVGVEGLMGCGHYCSAVSQEKDKFKNNKIVGKSFNNILSTFHRCDEYVTVKEDVYIGEGEREEQDVTVPMMVYDYHQMACVIDEVNASIMSSYYNHTCTRWTSAVWIWTMGVLVHDARILYNLEHPTAQLSQILFMEILSNQIFKVEKEKEIEDHVLEDVKMRTYCKVCYAQENKKKSMCKTYCPACGHQICSKCFNEPSRHWGYFVKKIVNGG